LVEIFREKPLETDTALGSRTLVVNEKDPAQVGVPVRAPVAIFSLRPAGSRPLEVVQVYGGTPPVAVSVAVWLLCTAPTGRAEVIIRKELEPAGAKDRAEHTPLQPIEQATTRVRIMIQ
jgi:hypothetical protein